MTLYITDLTFFIIRTSQSSILPVLSSLPPSLPRTCQPKRHIVFLKTHKTAGSTILNLLHRYGDKHGLFFALPIKYQFNYPNLFHSRRVKGINSPNRPQYDVLCHHMRFNLPEVKVYSVVWKVMQLLTQHKSEFVTNLSISKAITFFFLYLVLDKVGNH